MPDNHPGGIVLADSPPRRSPHHLPALPWRTAGPVRVGDSGRMRVTAQQLEFGRPRPASVDRVAPSVLASGDRMPRELGRPTMLPPRIRSMRKTPAHPASPRGPPRHSLPSTPPSSRMRAGHLPIGSNHASGVPVSARRTMPPTRSTHCRRSRATPLRCTPVCTPISNRARIVGWRSPASIPARQRGRSSVGPTCAANACGRRPRRRPTTAAAACTGHGGRAGADRRARSLVRIRLTIAPPSVTATPLNPSPGLSRRRNRADPSDNRRSSTAASVANASRCRQRDGNWPPCRPRRLTRGPPSTSTRPSLHSGGSDASNANPEPNAGQPASRPLRQPIIPRTRRGNYGRTCATERAILPGGPKISRWLFF